MNQPEYMVQSERTSLQCPIKDLQVVLAKSERLQKELTMLNVLLGAITEDLLKLDQQLSGME